MEPSIADYGWKKPETCSHNYLSPAILAIIKHESFSKETSILDAGCGGGAMVALLWQEGYTNVCGFDLSKSGIEVAKGAYPHLAGRYFIHNSYESNLPFGYSKGKFDLVISMEVIEHLYDPVAYLDNINAWLKPGGRLIITTPYHGYLKNLAIALTNRFDKHMTTLWNGGHIKFFSRQTLCRILEESGFKTMNFEGCGRIPFLWKSMVVLAQKG